MEDGITNKLFHFHLFCFGIFASSIAKLFFGVCQSSHHTSLICEIGTTNDMQTTLDLGRCVRQFSVRIDSFRHFFTLFFLSALSSAQT